MQNILNKVIRQFLCGVPLTELSFPVENLDIASQEYLLSRTVNCKLVLQYPLKVDYQKAFLKFLLKKLETEGLEVSEELYVTYGQLVARPDSQVECYKHYCVGEAGTVVTLQENINLISDGTTGLRTWQASLALAEWCLINSDCISQKIVLELGSGIGLTGLVVSLHCHPKKFTFSDCHRSVLNTLSRNVKLNVTNASIEDSSDLNEREILTAKVKNSVDLRVLCLPWEEVNSDICEQLGKIDLILAADVVYDSDLFKPLIDALRHLCYKCEVEDVVFACTERNSDTLKLFLEEIGQFFETTEEDCPLQRNFLWTPYPSVRVFRFKISAS